MEAVTPIFTLDSHLEKSGWETVMHFVCGCLPIKGAWPQEQVHLCFIVSCFVVDPELDSDDEEFDFIQPSLIKQLKQILDQYPDDGQILKVDPCLTILLSVVWDFSCLW